MTMKSPWNHVTHGTSNIHMVMGRSSWAAGGTKASKASLQSLRCALLRLDGREIANEFRGWEMINMINID